MTTDKKVNIAFTNLEFDGYLTTSFPPFGDWTDHHRVGEAEVNQQAWLIQKNGKPFQGKEESNLCRYQG